MVESCIWKLQLYKIYLRKTVTVENKILVASYKTKNSILLF